MSGGAPTVTPAASTSGQRPGVGALGVHADGQVVEHADPHARPARCLLRLCELVVKHPLAHLWNSTAGASRAALARPPRRVGPAAPRPLAASVRAPRRGRTRSRSRAGPGPLAGSTRGTTRHALVTAAPRARRSSAARFASQLASRSSSSRGARGGERPAASAVDRARDGAGQVGVLGNRLDPQVQRVAKRRLTGRYGDGSSGGTGAAACSGLTCTKSAPSSKPLHRARSVRSARSPTPQDRRDRREYSCTASPQPRPAATSAAARAGAA